MDFVMIAVVVALGVAITPGGPSPHPSPQRHFADQLSCEQAASIAAPLPGTKLVCVPAGGGGLIHTAH